MKQIKNDYDAFRLALILSVTAPTEKKHKAATKIAKELLPKLTKKQVGKAYNSAGWSLRLLMRDNIN